MARAVRSRSAEKSMDFYGVPVRHGRLGPRGVAVERRPDGAILVRATIPLRTYPRSITERIAHWADKTPAPVVFARRDPGSEGVMRVAVTQEGPTSRVKESLELWCAGHMRGKQVLEI
jgi:hypothetical protein